jgi:hypothetical protein
MLDSLLAIDTSLLKSARGLIGADYSTLVQILGESVVIWGALILLGIWIQGVIRRDVEYRLSALRIFTTIVIVFIVYAIINL